VGATENIKEGNEDIREVTARSCVLNFLLTFSFAQVWLWTAGTSSPRARCSVCWGSGHGCGEVAGVSWGLQRCSCPANSKLPGLAPLLSTKGTWHALKHLWSSFKNGGGGEKGQTANKRQCWDCWNWS